MGELDLAHRLSQFPEKKSRSLLIVPDMGTRAVAAAPSVTGTFPAIESAVLCAKAGLGAQRADIKQSRLLNYLRQIALTKSPHKANGRFLQFCKPRCNLLGHVPGVAVLCGIVVADTVLLVSFRRPGLAVRKVPGK
ncbi:hypothetical protein ES703_118484 [subsurface metagenome]